MQLVPVVARHLVLQHLASLLDRGDAPQGAGAHDAVLQPAKGALDLALGLWGEGLGDADTQQLHLLLPLRVALIGAQHVVTPDAVPALHEAKDAQGIHIVR